MVSIKHASTSAILLAVATGHMFLATPARLTTPAATNGPLLNTGENFPCQIPAGGGVDGPNTHMAVGSTQPLAFLGTTVHGGGSCQISVTYDFPPTASSTFKVIKSFEGGCPAHNQTGNLPGENADLADPDTYNFTMLDIPSGKAILSWSWLPKTGGTTPIEYYQQCASITITGASGNANSNYAALPDIYVANLASINGCTSQFADCVYPNPGPQVEKFLGAFSTYALSSCASHGGAAGTGTYVDVAGATAPPAPAVVGGGDGDSSVAGTTSADKMGSTKSPCTSNGFLNISRSAAVATSSGNSTTSSPVTSTSVGTGPGKEFTVGALTGLCTGPTWNCVGGHSFQQCAGGTWSTVMSLALGTECTPGQSATFEIKASNSNI